MENEKKETEVSENKVEEENKVAENEEKLVKENHEKLLEVVEKSINPDGDGGTQDGGKKDEKKAGEEENKVVEKKAEENLGKKGEVEDDSTNKDDSETTKKLSDLSLPKRLIQAAKRSHISDEEVIALGDNATLVLGKLADNLDVVSERLGALGRNAKVSVKPEEKKEVKKATLKLPEEMVDTEFGKQLQSFVTGLTEQVTGLEKRLSEKSNQSIQVNTKERDTKIDGFFDTVSKSYSEFGNSKTLTNAEIVMRQNVWEKADDIMIGSQLNGDATTLDEALQQAMSIYEGKNPTKVKEKLVNEVKQREKHLASRPTSKKGKTAEKTDRSKAVEAVAKHLKETGQNGW